MNRTKVRFLFIIEDHRIKRRWFHQKSYKISFFSTGLIDKQSMSTIKETETENTQEIGKLGNWKSITLNFVRPYFCLYPFNAPLEIKPENKVWVNANLSHIHWNFSVWSNYDKRLPDPEDQVACLSSLSLSCFRLLFIFSLRFNCLILTN